MAINNFNDLYWKLFNIAGGGTEPDVTKVLDSIVKSDRSKVDQYFTNAIDQIAFDTEDWTRLRAFLIDLFTANRSLITNSALISDPYNLSNDDLDELFRSFGYPESPRLKNFDNNPLESKVQLFLDLVNLYKIKGTPRSILEVLQYYGIPELDIFEFWLQKEDPTSLIFKGDVIVGTSINPSPVTLPFDLLTLGDPHWMMSESKVLELDALNKINLPSKSPYFAVQPIVEIGVENSILVRLVQDQYDGWKATGDLPPQNADITILGVSSSLLELYLLTLYSFQKDYQVGTIIEKFACYDGTATTTAEIMAEYDAIISEPILRARYLSELTPQNRTAFNSDPLEGVPLISRWERYLELFTRERKKHFLYDYNEATTNNAAELALNDINPLLIAELNALTADNTAVLQSLLKDLAIWVRNNVGFGFVNLGYIFFGLAQLFEDLKPVINFFKPYRARLIVLELLQFKNKLTESIPLNDAMSFGVDTEIFDFMTGDSAPCCSADTDATAYVCIDTTAGTFYSRDTYDCGSYHDIGAVTDISNPIEITIDQIVCDDFRCPAGCPDTGVTCCDSTAVQTNRDDCGLRCDSSCVPYWLDGTMALIVAPDSTDCTDMIGLTCETVPIVHSELLEDTFEKIEDLEIGSQSVTVIFAEEQANDSYLLNVNLINQEDGYLGISMYGIIITNKSVEGFTVLFSSPLDSVNYKLAWSANPNATFSGISNFIPGDDFYRVNFGLSLGSSDYAIGTSILNQGDNIPSIYNFTIVEKDDTGFKLQLSSPIDSTNYNLEWNVYDSTSFVPNGTIQIIPMGAEVLEVDIDPDEQDDQYMLSLSIINTVDATASIYSYMITKKNTNNFRVAFSSPIDSTNYYLSWAITYRDPEIFTFRQESGFRWFDTMGRFDCSHGFDMVEITMDVVSQEGVIIQENDGWLLQEDAVNENLNDYGLILD